MKKFEVDKIVGKSIIVTAVLLCLILGTVMVQNGYFNALTYNITCNATIVISVLFAILAIAMVVLGLTKKTSYYFYATCAAVIAIFFMLLKINYEIKALQFSMGAITVKFYMVAMAGFLALILATWVRAVVKIVRN